MVAAAESKDKAATPVLVVDDSIVFRRYLRDMLAEHEGISIGGEARNGIEALDLILKVRPRVILMDMEMPLMDGMTALQHLMIHCPTPTIMFSSLTGEGTFRAFDALKNGAVDFFSKDLLFDENRREVFSRLFIRKILGAAGMVVTPLEPGFDMGQEAAEDSQDEQQASRVVFCEECGARNIVESSGGATGAYCSQCGDLLVEYHNVERFKRNAHVTVFGGGEDSYRNLLRIIPRLDANLGGSVIIVIKADSSHVDTFTEYLDAISPIKVLRAREGMGLEGGFCYVASAQDQICLQQFSAQQTLSRMKNLPDGLGPIDLAMRSVAAALKKKCAGVLLSGNDLDGVRGLAELTGNGGEALALSPEECLSPRLIRTALGKVETLRIAGNGPAIARAVMDLCKQARSGGAVV